MLHPAPQVKHYFAFRLNRPAQCVIPVTREKQCKRPPRQCQLKNQKPFITPANARQRPFWGISNTPALQ